MYWHLMELIDMFVISLLLIAWGALATFMPGMLPIGFHESSVKACTSMAFLSLLFTGSKVGLALAPY